MENFNIVPDKGTFGGSVEVVNQNFLLAQQEMEMLEQKAGNIDKSYDPTKHSGLGKKFLYLKSGGSNILTQEDFNKENTIYVVQYDFDLNGADIAVPSGSIIRFDGGSIDNGTFRFNGATVEGEPKGTALYGVAYKDGQPLSHNYKRILPLSEVTEYAFASKRPFGCQLRIECSVQSICVTTDYVFVFGNDEYGTYAGKGVVALFDRKYNYLGQARIVEFGHANSCCIVDDYIFCTSSLSAVVYAPISNIVTACKNNSDSVSGVNTITLPIHTTYGVAYDHVRKEMLIIDSADGTNLYYNVFSYNTDNKTLTFKRRIDANITDSINNLIESPAITHRGKLRGATANITYKNGILCMVYWYHAGGDVVGAIQYQTAQTVGYFIEIDACTGLPVANLGLFRQIGPVAEPQGLCFDPENDDVFWTLSQNAFYREDYGRPAAAYINRVSYTKQVSSSIMTNLAESADTLSEQLSTRYVFVDNTSTDSSASISDRETSMNKTSTGHQGSPFKSLDTAILLSKTGKDFVIVLTNTGKDYDLGEFVIINQKVSIVGNGAKIKGKIQLQDADLSLKNLTFYNYEGGTAISSINSNVKLDNVSIINRNSTSTDPATILEGTCINLTHTSTLEFLGTLTIKGFQTGIIVGSDSNIVPTGDNLITNYVNVVYSFVASSFINSNIFIGTASPEIGDSSSTPTINNNKWRKAGAAPIPSIVDVSVGDFPSIKKGFKFTEDGQIAAKEFYIKRDSWITFSVLVKGSGTIQLRFMGVDNKNKILLYEVNSDNWKLISMTIPAFGINGTGNFYMRLYSAGTLYVCAPKAEFASKPTAWSSNPADNYGESSNRPVGVTVGYQYFDTSLSPKRPIYWNGTNWVDATGNIV